MAVDVTDHIGFAKRQAKSFSRYFHMEDPDDLQGDALLGLVKAGQSFDPSRGVIFITYAGHVIRTEILRGVRSRRCTGLKSEWRSLDVFRPTTTEPLRSETDGDEENDSRTLRATNDTEAEALQDDISHLCALVKGKEAEVLKALAKGLTRAETAAHLGVSVSRVSQLINAARARLAEKGYT